MWISSKIRKHISDMPEGQPFATREMLGYGPRKAVDSAIYRLIDQQFIVRVARGIFVKATSAMPTLAQIVLAKAKAFGKDVLLLHGNDAAVALHIGVNFNGKPTVVAGGSSTSFWCNSSDYGKVQVHFRTTNQLSKKFENTHVGIFMRAMKSLPQEDRILERFVKARSHLDRAQRAELMGASRWMPGWLTNMFWITPNVKPTPQWGPHSWDFLKKYMTPVEFADYLRINVQSLLPFDRDKDEDEGIHMQ